MRAILAMLLVVPLVCGCSQRGGGGTSAIARVGSAAPDWTEPTADGKQLALRSLRGKAVYLNFFATWCPPCNAEAPGINALQQRYASRGLQVVGIDELENREKALGFVRKYGLTYPAVVDDGTLQSQYEINGLPVHVFVGRDGVIKKMVAGEMSIAQIDAAVQSIL